MKETNDPEEHSETHQTLLETPSILSAVSFEDEEELLKLQSQLRLPIKAPRTRGGNDILSKRGELSAEKNHVIDYTKALFVDGSYPSEFLNDPYTSVSMMIMAQVQKGTELYQLAKSRIDMMPKIEKFRSKFRSDLLEGSTTDLMAAAAATDSLLLSNYEIYNILSSPGITSIPQSQISLGNFIDWLSRQDTVDMVNRHRREWVRMLLTDALAGIPGLGPEQVSGLYDFLRFANRRGIVTLKGLREALLSELWRLYRLDFQPTVIVDENDSPQEQVAQQEANRQAANIRLTAILKILGVHENGFLSYLMDESTRTEITNAMMGSNANTVAHIINIVHSRLVKLVNWLNDGARIEEDDSSSMRIPIEVFTRALEIEDVVGEMSIDPLVLKHIEYSRHVASQPIVDAYKMLLDNDLLPVVESKYQELGGRIFYQPYWLAAKAPSGGDRSLYIRYINTLGDAVRELTLGNLAVEEAAQRTFDSFIDQLQTAYALCPDVDDRFIGMVRYMPAINPRLIAHAFLNSIANECNDQMTENVAVFRADLNLLRNENIPHEILPFASREARNYPVDIRWAYGHWISSADTCFVDAIYRGYLDARVGKVLTVLQNAPDRSVVHDLCEILIRRRTDLDAATGAAVEIVAAARRMNYLLDALVIGQSTADHVEEIRHVFADRSSVEGFRNQLELALSS